MAAWLRGDAVALPWSPRMVAPWLGRDGHVESVEEDMYDRMSVATLDVRRVCNNARSHACAQTTPTLGWSTGFRCCRHIHEQARTSSVQMP